MGKEEKKKERRKRRGWACVSLTAASSGSGGGVLGRGSLGVDAHDVGVRLGGLSARLVVLQDPLDKELGGIFDTTAILGRCLEPSNETVVVTVLLHLTLITANALSGKISLVGEEDDGDGSSIGERELGVDVVLPTLDGIKRVFACDVKDDHCSHGLLVVDAGHVSKALLSSNIPELETDERLRVPLDHLEGKVDTDSGFVVHGEDTVDVSLDDTRLSGSNISNNKDLVESLVHSFTGLDVSHFVV